MSANFKARYHQFVPSRWYPWCNCVYFQSSTLLGGHPHVPLGWSGIIFPSPLKPQKDLKKEGIRVIRRRTSEPPKRDSGNISTIVADAKSRAFWQKTEGSRCFSGAWCQWRSWGVGVSMTCQACQAWPKVPFKGVEKTLQKTKKPLKNRPKGCPKRKGSWIPAAMVASGSVNLKTSTTQVSKYYDKTTWWRANVCRFLFPISLLNFRSSLGEPQMVLGVELLVIFSCDSFPSLPVIPFDREDWYDWNPLSQGLSPQFRCLWVNYVSKEW